MGSRRSNPRDSDRVRTRTGSANSERIRSGDVSEALTEVLREETRLLWISTQEAKELEGEKSVARVKSSSPTDPNSVAHLVRHFKPAGCPLPSLQNMMEREAYVEMAVAHPKAMEAGNEFAATLEKRSDELYVINKAASLEARLRVVSNERKSAFEKVSFLEAKVESSANKFSDDLRRATYDAKKALADSYLDVLVSLKEKWEKKKAATDCQALLREEVELDVMAVSDFSVGKLDLPQTSEDLPEDFFARVSSAANGADDVTKCSGGQFEDGKFGIEVGDFSARRLYVWVVLSDTGRRSGFVGFFQCADRYRDLKAYFLFGLALDFIGCVVVWPPQNYVDSFLWSWGWRAR
ncbi:hypothetical protein F2Q68_00034415 [Brassica cretica]|uniref:Uncharacterized protein n=1 Tax=Brassica cretica TaxID=69181 RepID=A0A8S9GZ81_BRACR|nr:hypothetical protein F2Q68_00034415 [Brassica cretica]KAF3486110.1 hypothetical protein F2Q69_00053207 [Brassica cretica]